MKLRLLFILVFLVACGDTLQGEPALPDIDPIPTEDIFIQHNTPIQLLATTGSIGESGRVTINQHTHGTG